MLDVLYNCGTKPFICVLTNAICRQWIVAAASDLPLSFKNEYKKKKKKEEQLLALFKELSLFCSQEGSLCTKPVELCPFTAGLNLAWNSALVNSTGILLRIRKGGGMASLRIWDKSDLQCPSLTSLSSYSYFHQCANIALQVHRVGPSLPMEHKCSAKRAVDNTCRWFL